MLFLIKNEPYENISFCRLSKFGLFFFKMASIETR